MTSPLQERFTKQGIQHPEQLTTTAEQIIRYLKKTAEHNPLQHLQTHWYETVDNNNPDYGVYNTDEYLAEVWACWRVYSRRYLHTVPPHLSPNPETIIDLGCGMGDSTLELSRLHPHADTYGTNIPGTSQTAIAETLGVKIIPDTDNLHHRADIVFASEYFEHFQEPVAHLNRIIETTAARTLITANAFNTEAIGHFRKYIHEGTEHSGNQISLKFNNRLRELGYVAKTTGIWNNRPRVWEQK